MQSLSVDCRQFSLYFIDKLRTLQTSYPTAGAPAPKEAARIVNRLHENGVLISVSGRDVKVLKIRPPLVFAPERADLRVKGFAQALDQATMA